MKMVKLHLCTTCRSKVPQEDIRFDGLGMELVCVGCFIKKHGMETVRRTKNVEELISPIEERRLQKKLVEQTVGYICKRCNYSFSRKKDFYVSKCTNCGTNDIVEELSGRAQELLDSIDDEKNYY